VREDRYRLTLRERDARFQKINEDIPPVAILFAMTFALLFPAGIEKPVYNFVEFPRMLDAYVSKCVKFEASKLHNRVIRADFGRGKYGANGTYVKATRCRSNEILSRGDCARRRL